MSTTSPAATGSVPTHPSPADASIADDAVPPIIGLVDCTWELSAAETIRAIVAERDARGVDRTQPYMVGIVGIPGSGKTTSSTVLGDMLKDPGCLVMPCDGYHYTMRDLQNFPNADDAIYRRGAPDTFDVAALTRDLHRIRFGCEEEIMLPGFDHAVGDPEENAYTFIREKHRIVITEGLYLLHDEQGWNDVRDYFDYTVFLEANVDVSMDRLKVRNKVIPGYTAEEIQVRVDAVDRTNAMTVMQSKSRASLVVESAAMVKYKK